LIGEENFVLFFTFAYPSAAKGGKEQNVLQPINGSSVFEF